jgi:hypothetical protein
MEFGQGMSYTTPVGSGGLPSAARVPSDATEAAGEPDDARVGTTT